MNSETGNRQHDDTVETNLADDLLSGGDTTVAVQDQTQVIPAAAAAASGDDDDYLDTGQHKRSRVTTGLVVALIFALGVLAGAMITRVLVPEPAPQIVYILSDAETHSPSPTPR